MIPYSCKRSNSFLTATQIAKGTWRGLQNLGAVWGCTCNLALYGIMMPNSSIKSHRCRFTRAFTDSDQVVWTDAISPQSIRKYFSQFRAEKTWPSSLYDSQYDLLFFAAILHTHPKLTHHFHRLLCVRLENERGFPQLQFWEQAPPGLVRDNGDGGSSVKLHCLFLLADQNCHFDRSDEWSVNL